MGKPRITLHIDPEIAAILNNMPNKAQFVRQAIQFYITHSDTIKQINRRLTEIEEKLTGSSFRIEEKKKDPVTEKKHKKTEAIMKIINLGGE